MHSQPTVSRLPRGKHYVAQCLNIDVSSFGDTEDEALAHLREALELYFEDAPASDAVAVEAAEVRTLTLQGCLSSTRRSRS